MRFLISVLKRCVPVSARAAIRRTLGHTMRIPFVRDPVLDFQDFLDDVRGRRCPLTPPRKLVYGIGDGIEIGETYLRHFRELAQLGRSESVLDVGCGIGRMAVPLASYLGPSARYEGIDIVSTYVDWCRGAISARYPRFRFQHLDVYNREYNPRGRLAGTKVQFPFPDGTFDFVFLTSVFTHLMPEVASRYLSEVARVLRPGGRCLGTFFLLNDEADSLAGLGRGAFRLLPLNDSAKVADVKNPEACIALREDFVLDGVRSAGFVPRTPTYYGSWCGRHESKDYQDIMIFDKPL